MTADALPVRLRSFRPGDAVALWNLLHDAVHGRTQREYDAAQRAAWAPPAMPADRAERIAAVGPVVAERGAVPLGFADLQPDGHVTFFYVAAAAAGQGVARLLMQHLIAQAYRRGIAALAAEVSDTAQPFFARHGWWPVRRQQVQRKGIMLSNTVMTRPSAAGRGPVAGR